MAQGPELNKECQVYGVNGHKIIKQKECVRVIDTKTQQKYPNKEVSGQTYRCA